MRTGTVGAGGGEVGDDQDPAPETPHRIGMGPGPTPRHWVAAFADRLDRRDRESGTRCGRCDRAGSVDGPRRDAGDDGGGREHGCGSGGGHQGDPQVAKSVSHLCSSRGRQDAATGPSVRGLLVDGPTHGQTPLWSASSGELSETAHLDVAQGLVGHRRRDGQHAAVRAGRLRPSPRRESGGDPPARLGRDRAHHSA